MNHVKTTEEVQLNHAKTGLGFGQQKLVLAGTKMVKPGKNWQKLKFLVGNHILDSILVIPVLFQIKLDNFTTFLCIDGLFIFTLYA